jgi:creatinine amidohydrolase
MLWHEKSWPELKSIDKETPVIVPLGSIEQHGHALPLVVDTLQVSTVADRAEKTLADRALFLPTQWLGCSHHHKDFPGTVSLLPDVYSMMIQSIARSVLRAGFRRLFFLNGHGGNQIPASQALIQLVAEDDGADGALLAFSSWWAVGKDSIQQHQVGTTTKSISHACEYETSLVLAIRPDLVNRAAIIDEPSALETPWYANESGGKVSVFRRFHRMTTSGSMGQPSAATAQKGAAILDAVVKDVVAFVDDFRGWPLPQKLGPK